jgi:hypothetical protein
MCLLFFDNCQESGGMLQPWCAVGSYYAAVYSAYARKWALPLQVAEYLRATHGDHFLVFNLAAGESEAVDAGYGAFDNQVRLGLNSRIYCLTVGERHHSPLGARGRRGHTVACRTVVIG